MPSSRIRHATAIVTIALAGSVAAQMTPGATAPAGTTSGAPAPAASAPVAAVVTPISARATNSPAAANTSGAVVTRVANATTAPQRYPVVVELFTAQGCSACPPADALLARLADRKGVIPLALHVDYWDYIGWVDKFASPAFTARQKAYARAIGSRTIYTPQLIIGGEERIEGARPMDVAEFIQDHKRYTSPVDLTLSRKGDSVQIKASSARTFAKKVSLLLIRYRPAQTVAIRRGENAGRTITYRNIVTALHKIGSWDGATPISLHETAAGSEPVVVIVQKPGPGEIIAAAVVK